MTYNEIVCEIKKFQKPKPEKNIFAIGGRGHYENPISDILSFFINPMEEHDFKALFLRSLFQAANIESPLLELTIPPSREKYTNKGNRIDLIIEGDSWVLVVENKIRHQAVNPFNDYMEYVRSSYKRKEQYYVLLSVHKENPPKNWINVTWEIYIKHLKENIEAQSIQLKTTKWPVIMNEFILNIKYECGDNNMSEERINFVKNNYETIQEMKDMLKEYIQHLTNRGIQAIKLASEQEGNDVFSRQHDWGTDGIALRLISKKWGGNTNITLLVRRDGSLRIQFYIYDVMDTNVVNLKMHIDENKYRKYWVEQKTIRCFGFFDDFDHENVFHEILEISKGLNGFYPT